MESDDINNAFEFVLSKIDSSIKSLNEDGKKALERRDYGQARQASDEAARVSDFREKVRTLLNEWQQLFASKNVLKPVKERTKKIIGPKLSPGLRTSQNAYHKPILETLIELGGAGSMNAVLDRVGIKMKGVLNEYDYRPKASDPSQVRWRNAAAWCRFTLVKEGLLRSNSPHGIWEISEEGRKVLKSSP